MEREMTDILLGGDGQADSSIVEAEESPEHLLGQAGDDDEGGLLVASPSKAGVGSSSGVGGRRNISCAHCGLRHYTNKTTCEQARKRMSGNANGGHHSSAPSSSAHGVSHMAVLPVPAEDDAANRSGFLDASHIDNDDGESSLSGDEDMNHLSQGKRSADAIEISVPIDQPRYKHARSLQKDHSRFDRNQLHYISCVTAQVPDRRKKCRCCKKKTATYCVTCSVPLCSKNLTEQNCFWRFHMMEEFEFPRVT